MMSLDVVIVGAGLAGLMAARTLASAGWRMAVLDKGRSVGGRLATRWLGHPANQADHGAQFFTVRSLTFQHEVDKWLSAGVVEVWTRGWSDRADAYPRYAAPGGLNALARHLARDLPVQVNQTVTAVQPADQGWRVCTQAGPTWLAQRLLLTAPLPQSLALLAAGGVTLPPAQQAELAAVTYAPCLCALFRLAHPSRLSAPGALSHPAPPVSWLVDNRLKGLSVETVLTVHASPAYSQAHYADPDETVLADMWTAIQPWVNDPAPAEQQLKRWRYAQTINPHPQRHAQAQGVPPLFFAGDSFSEPRIEGAALSGLSAATALLST